MFLSKYNIEIALPEVGIPSFIYRITNTKLNKAYIGQTKDVEKRICNHLEGQGSKPLLCDIVKQGLADFKFEVLEEVYTNVDATEDQYIDLLNTLHPNGYNLRVNHVIEANGSQIDLNCIPIQAKFCFKKNENTVFSIGEFTQARAYQLLTNIHDATETKMIKKKKLFKFNYFEMKTTSDAIFMPGKIYDLELKYKFADDLFLVNTCEPTP